MRGWITRIARSAVHVLTAERGMASPDSVADLQAQSSTLSVSGQSIEAEYKSIVQHHLAEAGIGGDMVQLSVHRSRRQVDGLFTFVCLVRLTAWDKNAALRLLIGAPLLQEKVRRSAKTTWLHEISRFGGLWIHPSGDLRNTPALAELSSAVKQFTQGADLSLPPDTSAPPSVP